MRLGVGVGGEVVAIQVRTIPNGFRLSHAGYSAEAQVYTRREAELAASERRFRVMTSAMPQMVWTTRPDGFHDYYNDRWYEYTGQTEAQAKGFGWVDAAHPEDVRTAPWTSS